jgi:pyruvate formate lyase activating enzyme
MAKPADITPLLPGQLVALAQKYVASGNIGVAYTYNEPLINYEYILDCSKAIRDAGLNNVLVTNGFIQPEPLKKLLPYIDALNIDLKGFTEGFYEKIKGRLTAVKENITLAAHQTHVEVTTLIIPGENDNEEEIDALARFLAEIRTDIPLHLSRFFPRYEMTDKSPTPTETIFTLKAVAEKHLQHVYTGNMR